MKKFLSLVLALVMTMSLVTVSAGAKDFTDSDKLTDVQFEEAVNVMSEMGIIDGYTDGSFQPQGTLTRGAAAKIIACMMLGKTTAEALGTQAAPFKDVPVGSTFAGYIAYCSESGIIDGYSDGTFRPGNTLTGFAFLKMLLTALGYDSAIEGFANNANWTVNVAGRAIEAGLTKGNENFVGTKAATREEACLYAVNALQATLVEYESKGTSITINGTVIAQGASKPTYVTSNIHDAATSINDTTDNEKNGWTVEFAEKYQPDLALKDTTDAFGRPAHTWTWKKAEIGTYVDFDKMVAEYTTEVTGKDLYDLLGKTTIDDNTVLVYVDGETEKNILGDAYFTAGQMIKANTDAVGETGNGVLTQVFLDTEDDEITVAVINTYVATADRDYDSKKEEVTFSIWGVTDAGKNQFVKDTTDTSENLVASIEDFDVEDVEKDDLYLVTIAEGAIQTLEQPEVISDTEITAFKQGSNLTTGGTKYSFADSACYDGEALEVYTSEDGATINLKDTTYNVILDPYGYVIGVEEIDPAENWVFVTGYDLNSSNLTNKTADFGAIFLDGTMKTIKVDTKKSDELMTAISSAKAYNVNTWCSYTVSDEGVYTLKPAADQYAWDVSSSTVEINAKHISLKSGASSYVYGNDETVYLNVSLDNITVEDSGTKIATIIDDVDNVTTGIKNTDIEVKNVTVNTVSSTTAADEIPAAEVYTLFDGGYATAVVVIGEDQGVSSNYAYVTSSNVKQESYDKTEKEFTWTREVVIDGKVTEITYKGDTIDVINPSSTGAGNIDDTMDQGNWYKVTYYADGTVKKTEALAGDFTGSAATEDFLDDVKFIEDAIDNSNGLVLYSEGFVALDNTSLKYEKGSLYIVNSDKTGFSVSPEVKVVLCNANGAGKAFATVDDEYEGYTGLEDAISDLNENFVGRISAILEGGVATSIILNCTAKDPGFNGGSDTNKADKYSSVVDQDITAGLNLLDMSTGSYSISSSYAITMNVLSGANLQTQVQDLLAYKGYTDISAVTYKSGSYYVTATNPDGIVVELTLAVPTTANTVYTVNIDGTDTYVLADQHLDDIGVTGNAKVVSGGVTTAVDDGDLSTTAVVNGAVYTSDAYTKITPDADVTSATTIGGSTGTFTQTTTKTSGAGIFQGGAWWLEKDAVLTMTFTVDTAHSSSETLTVTASGATVSAAAVFDGSAAKGTVKTVTITAPAATTSDITVSVSAS